MVTIKIVQLSHQVRKDGTCPILIRVTQDRKVKYVKAGYAVKPSQFKEGSENWVYKHGDSTIINMAIEAKRSNLLRSVATSDIEGVEVNLNDLTGKKNTDTFFRALMKRMEVHESRNQAAMFRKLSELHKHLKLAWGKDVALSSLNKTHAEKYIAWRYKQGSKVNTIKKDLSMLSGVLLSADYTGKNYFKISQAEFKHEDTNREKLTAEEIKLLETVKLTGLPDVARDMFLFSFYTHGMRFQNVALFEEKMIKNGIIKYRMNKGKKIREIEVHKKLARIIDKYKGKSLYLFPVLQAKPKDNWEIRDMIGAANALVNLNLKRAAVISGIEKNISMHVARHSFAYLSLKRGVSRNILKDSLGHSKYATTEGYLKSLSDDEINEAVKGLYD